MISEPEYCRDWIAGTPLRRITYELKVFYSKRVEDKIIVRAGRSDLAKPVSRSIVPLLHNQVLIDTATVC